MGTLKQHERASRKLAFLRFAPRLTACIPMIIVTITGSFTCSPWHVDKKQNTIKALRMHTNEHR